MKYRIVILFGGKTWRSPFFRTSVQKCQDLIAANTVECIKSAWIEVLR